MRWLASLRHRRLPRYEVSSRSPISYNLPSCSRSLLRLQVRWLLIGWMFVISAVAYLDRVNISIAGKLMEAEFRLSDIQLGWVFSSFVLGYALFQAPGGRMADQYGPRKVNGIAAIWWAVFTALTGLAP